MKKYKIKQKIYMISESELSSNIINISFDEEAYHINYISNSKIDNGIILGINETIGEIRYTIELEDGRIIISSNDLLFSTLEEAKKYISNYNKKVKRDINKILDKIL